MWSFVEFYGKLKLEIYKFEIHVFHKEMYDKRAHTARLPYISL